MDSKTHSRAGDAGLSGRGTGSCVERLTAYRETLKRDLTEYVRLEVRWSWLRLATFLACVVVLAAVGFVYGLLPTALVALPALAVFCYTVARHIDWKDKRTLTERLLTIAGESLHASVEASRPVRDWRRPQNPPEAAMVLPAFVESGPTWPLTGQERDDLDLYSGPVGIFGLLNRSSTDAGARRLRDMLDGPCLSGEHIQRRQQAVRWLAEHDTQRIDIMASVLLLRSQSRQLDALVRLLRETAPHAHRTASKCIRAWSLVSGLGFAYGLAQVLRGYYTWSRPLILLLVFNMLIARFVRPMLAQLRASVLPWVELVRALRGLLLHARHARENLPDETALGALRQCLDDVVTRGEIPSLCERLGWMGLGGLGRGLLNVVVFYDLHVGESILARVVPNRERILDGLAAMAEFEALASLACFSAEQPVVCYPTFTSETVVSISEGRHPLIAAAHLTPNGVHLTGAKRMWVITGPNAAGKSTFVRMVGVNLLLAQIGCAAAAREMALSPVRLVTDVRIRDDLAKNESYFLSEVRRLRRMVVDTGQDTPLLGLIDEPFRGTNSSERTAAGIALVEHLLASGNLFVLATHEEKLAQTAAGSASAENYHFQEHLGDAGITFDYRLRPGPAGTKTAIRILEQEQYPAGLVERARELMQLGGAGDQDSS